MKKIHCTIVKMAMIIVLTATLISLGVAPIKPYTSLEYNQPQAELYVGASADPNLYDPFNVICEYEPSENFTVYVKAKNISDLISMDFYMYFNPNVTESTAVRYGASWGTVLVDYIGIAGIINNTKGSIEGYGAARLAPTLSGNLTLFEIDFHMKDWGESLLQITDTPIVMLNSTEQEILSPMTNGYFNCPPPTPPPYGPTAVFTYRPLAPLTNEMVTFNASASLPGFNGTHDMPIVSYAWNFGDASPIVIEYDPVTTRNYTVAGDYTVILNVTDSQGLWNTTSKIITVTPVPPVPLVHVYLEPSTITATEVGQNFTVEIRVDNITDLFALETGLTWDPNFLEVNISGPHNGFAFGPVWGTVLVDYIGVMGEINNITGEIYAPCGVSRLATGINGTGLVLAYIDFVAKATGTSNVHLAEIVLINSKEEEISTNVIDVFTVIVEENPPFHIITVHNLTGSPEVPLRLRLTDHTFSQEDKKISFNITGPPGTAVFWNVTIPTTLLDDNATHPWKIYLDGTDITDSVIKYENDTHTAFYFAFNSAFYIHKIEIQGSWVVPEFPLAMILPLLIFVTLAVALLGKKVQPTKRRVPSGPPRR